MPQWEYKIKKITASTSAKDSLIEEWLNELGKSHWELVVVQIGGFYIFKKEIFNRISDYD